MAAEAKQMAWQVVKQLLSNKELQTAYLEVSTTKLQRDILAIIHKSHKHLHPTGDEVVDEEARRVAAALAMEVAALDEDVKCATFLYKHLLAKSPEADVAGLMQTETHELDAKAASLTKDRQQLGGRLGKARASADPGAEDRIAELQAQILAVGQELDNVCQQLVATRTTNLIAIEQEVVLMGGQAPAAWEYLQASFAAKVKEAATVKEDILARIARCMAPFRPGGVEAEGPLPMDIC
jgi:hypothetical protein